MGQTNHASPCQSLASLQWTGNIAAMASTGRRYSLRETIKSLGEKMIIDPYVWVWGLCDGLKKPGCRTMAPVRAAWHGQVRGLRRRPVLRCAA